MEGPLPGERRERPMQELKVEEKYVGGESLKARAQAWLEHACLPDPLFPEGTVTSIYYDTAALTSYDEKRQGDFLKTKCRLRWYDSDAVTPVTCATTSSGAEPVTVPASGGTLTRSASGATRSDSRPARSALAAGEQACTAFLEAKYRIGGARCKVRMRLALERAWLEGADLADPRFLDLLSRWDTAEERERFAGLAPSIEIRYRRRRFVCPASLSRVCLDTDIEAGRANGRLIASMASVRVPLVVLEIKEQGGGPVPWLEFLYRAGFRRRSYSKYGDCVARLLNEEY
jgi:hypothetical protein